MNNKITLDYYLAYDAFPISLSLWEAEMYYAAIPVQQLIGNLIYYSNFGRYELRIAQTWNRIDAFTWEFKLKKGFKCENGELITSDSFKKSLERSIFYLHKKGGSPIFKKLKGYDKFVRQNNKILNLNDLEGISASEDTIKFIFEKPVRSGLIQLLSFAPYGYISAGNLNEDGSWKNPLEFISSGPFKLKEIQFGKFIHIERRENTNFEINSKSPTDIFFYQKNSTDLESLNFQNTIKENPNVIIDASRTLKIPDLEHFELVKEYMSAIVLGNFNKGIFSSKQNRAAFNQQVRINKKNIEKENSDFKYSDSIYPLQTNEFSHKKDISDLESTQINGSVLIRGSEPNKNNRNWQTWEIIRNSLNNLNIRYSFSDSSDSRSDLTNELYDIRIANPSVGGGVETWLLDVLFCSKLNSNLPDPNNKVCDLIENFENDLIDELQLSDEFDKIIKSDEAVFPIYHFGLNLYLGKGVNKKSISPTISVLRLDQIELKNE